MATLVSHKTRRRLEGLPPLPKRKPRSTRCNHYVPETEKEARARYLASGRPLRAAQSVVVTLNRPCGAAEVVRGSNACYTHLPDAIRDAKKKLKWHKGHVRALDVLVAAMSKVLYNTMIKRSCE